MTVTKDLITDDIFNNLDWETVKASEIEDLVKGYTLIGVDNSFAWSLENGEDAIDGVILYLHCKNRDSLLLVEVLADTDPKEEDKSPVEFVVATLDINLLLNAKKGKSK